MLSVTLLFLFIELFKLLKGLLYFLLYNLLLLELEDLLLSSSDNILLSFKQVDIGLNCSIFSNILSSASACDVDIRFLEFYNNSSNESTFLLYRGFLFINLALVLTFFILLVFIFIYPNLNYFL